MSTSDWTTYDMRRNGQAEWLVKTGEKIIAALRQSGGLPSIVTTGYLTVDVPTLAKQADVMNEREDKAPGTVIASGVLKFLD